jgi:ribosomal protein L1
MEVSDDTVKKVMAVLGRRGGMARAKAMTAEQRRKSALKASKAAAAARTRQAKQRKAAAQK